MKKPDMAVAKPLKAQTAPAVKTKEASPIPHTAGGEMPDPNAKKNPNAKEEANAFKK